MEILTESQLILLSNLIYLDGVAVNGIKDVTVGEVVEKLLRNGGERLDDSRTTDSKKIGTINEYPTMVSRERWIEILEAIQADDQLSN